MRKSKLKVYKGNACIFTKDKGFLEEYFPVLDRAMEFVISMQTDSGDVLWALDEKGSKLDDSLITGCSSIYKSLECFKAIKKNPTAF